MREAVPASGAYALLNFCAGIFMRIDLKTDEKAGAVTSDANALKGRRKMPAQHERGTTLVEVAVAGALLALALANLFALYGTTVKEAKAGDTAAIAQQNCIARIDQMRNLTWDKTTDPSYIQNNLLANPTSPDNASVITNEAISIYPAAVPQTSPLPTATPTPSSPTPTPSSLIGERLIRVEVTTEWKTSGITHTRQLSTLISKSGTKNR